MASRAEAWKPLLDALEGNDGVKSLAVALKYAAEVNQGQVTNPDTMPGNANTPPEEQGAQ